MRESEREAKRGGRPAWLNCLLTKPEHRARDGGGNYTFAFSLCKQLVSISTQINRARNLTSMFSCASISLLVAMPSDTFSASTVYVCACVNLCKCALLARCVPMPAEGVPPTLCDAPILPLSSWSGLQLFALSLIYVSALYSRLARQLSARKLCRLSAPIPSEVPLLARANTQGRVHATGLGVGGDGNGRE